MRVTVRGVARAAAHRKTEKEGRPRGVGSAPDEAGDTWQERTLSDGSKHRVLKNFPSREALLQAVATSGRDARVREWPYYWALEYTTLAR